LVDTLLGRGHRVVAVDNLSTGNLANLAGALRNPCFRFIESTVDNAGLMNHLIPSVDVVFHLAATVGVTNVLRDTLRTAAGIRGTQTVLEAAARNRTVVVLTSSSEVYGKSARVPYRENADLILGSTSVARWSYAAAKIMDEVLALGYWRQHRVPVAIARLFNVIGPRQAGESGMVVPRFFRQAMESRPLTVYGDGRQTRSFTFVSDIVAWLIALAALPGAAGEIFNLGNPHEISIQELACKVIAIAGSGSTIEHLPYESVFPDGYEDCPRRVPVIRKVVYATGYAPRVGVDQALMRIYHDMSRGETPQYLQTAV
jgi:UDP-glucose 4-epimerase